MAEDWKPEDRLREMREREQIVAALAVALADWRGVLEVVETAATESDAQAALTSAFGFTPVQATAVLSSQFRRVSQLDRDRIAAELEQLRRDIGELGDGT